MPLEEHDISLHDNQYWRCIKYSPKHNDTNIGIISFDSVSQNCALASFEGNVCVVVVLRLIF